MRRNSKHTRSATYYHLSAFDQLPAKTLSRVRAAWHQSDEPDFNVLKLTEDSVSFLLYPNFDTEPHPELERYVSYSPRGMRHVEYRSTSRPILHRKELLVSEDYPGREQWKRRSKREEAAGLLGRSDIGTSAQWRRALRANPGHDDEDLEAMARTYRSRPGLRTVVAKFVADIDPERTRVLDFGAGPDAPQVEALKKLGFDIVGYEWPPRKDDQSARAEAYTFAVLRGLLDPRALSRKYDLVLASNVLNVQTSPERLDKTLREITSVMGSGSVFICNLPSSPRPIWQSGASGNSQLEHVLCLWFDNVERHSDVWVCSQVRSA